MLIKPRLFQSFQPTHYSLNLDISKRIARKFSGTVTITGSFTNQQATELVLHAKDLTISSTSIDDFPCTYTTTDDEVTLVCPATLINSGQHTISIQFSGLITDAMHGLYPCFFEVDGQKHELLATQCESHHAREVFPCIDEPEAKASFDLTLHTEQNLTVLGNMPIVSQTDHSDQLITTFETSPRMSPYLLAFVAGKLQSKSASTKNGTKVTVYATHAQTATSLDFALVTAVKSIEFFNEYFDTPYPLPKCDHVALPDFSAGAMENWGLITYREMCLLADTDTAISTKEYIATVITHETSHQWFGNLVTMRWWDDLWLNESFATLMEYMAVDAIYPEWNIWMTFATQETLSALRRDYLPGVQAVKTVVNHPDEISSLFDPSIVYAKGARLLKMLHNYIGDEAFTAGLKQYFKDHAYANTTGDDLWAAFSKSTGRDIGTFMRSWLEQPGMPVVSAKQVGNSLIFSQKRFLIGDNDQPETLWPIPLNANSELGIELFDQKEQTIPAPNSTLYLNKGNSVHFVTNYDAALYDRIVTAIQTGRVDTIDRLAILHETSLMARAGTSTATTLFNLLEAYRGEQQEPVWDIIAMVIADLKRFVEDEPAAEAQLKQFVCIMAEPLFEKLGWDIDPKENESDTKLRATIIGLLGYAEHPEVVSRALHLFHEADDISKLPGELRGVIYALTAKAGDIQDRKKLFDLYTSSQVAELQQDVMAGLSAAKDTETLTTLINSMTDSAIVRDQDIDKWFVYLIRNRYARQATWHWMVSHWDWITEKFDGDKSYDSFPRYAASALSSYKWKDAYDEFFAPYKDQPALTRAIDLGSKDIAGRAAWITRDKAALFAALQNHFADTTS